MQSSRGNAKTFPPSPHQDCSVLSRNRSKSLRSTQERLLQAKQWQKKSPRPTCHTCRSLLDPFQSAQKQMKWLFNRMYCIVITCDASHFSYLAREGVELLAVRQGQGWIPLSGGSTSESSCSLCCVPGFNDGFLIFCHLTGVCSALARTWRASRISSNVSVGWLFAGWASGYLG